MSPVVQARADLFVTNDFEMQKQKIPDLRSIVGLDGKIF